MAGNSQRRGAKRKPGTKKGATVGSGGQRRQGLQGKGPTPRAEDREGHPAARRTRSAARRDGGASGGGASGGPRRPGPGPATAAGSGKGTGSGTGSGKGSGPGKGSGAGRGTGSGPGKGPGAGRGRGPAGARATRRAAAEHVVGRNPVVEALRAGVPATALHVGQHLDSDDRVREVLLTAADRRIPILEVTRAELDRLADGAVHQGVVLTVPSYTYADPVDLLDAAARAGQAPMIIALDGVTDPRNLGAVVRSAAAFGAHGVVVPERRAAGMTAAAWRTSAGAAARVPVARAVNLTRALRSYAQAGCTVVGLAAEAAVPLDRVDRDVLAGPLVVVVGGEGDGLGRLVGQTCDLLVGIPMTAGTESLNASVAAGIVMYAAATARR